MRSQYTRSVLKWSAWIGAAIAALGTSATAGAAMPTKLPIFYGNALQKPDKNGSARFRLVIKNNTGVRIKQIVVIFKSYVAFDGKTSVPLVYYKPLKGWGWSVTGMAPGSSRVLYFSMARPKKIGVNQVCAGAALAIPGLYWSTLYTEPCFMFV